MSMTDAHISYQILLERRRWARNHHLPSVVLAIELELAEAKAVMDRLWKEQHENRS